MSAAVKKRRKHELNWSPVVLRPDVWRRLEALALEMGWKFDRALTSMVIIWREALTNGIANATERELCGWARVRGATAVRFLVAIQDRKVEFATRNEDGTWTLHGADHDIARIEEKKERAAERAKQRWGSGPSAPAADDDAAPGGEDAPLEGADGGVEGDAEADAPRNADSNAPRNAQRNAPRIAPRNACSMPRNQEPGTGNEPQKPHNTPLSPPDGGAPEVGEAKTGERKVSRRDERRAEELARQRAAEELDGEAARVTAVVMRLLRNPSGAGLEHIEREIPPAGRRAVEAGASTEHERREAWQTWINDAHAACERGGKANFVKGLRDLVREELKAEQRAGGGT